MISPSLKTLGMLMVVGALIALSLAILFTEGRKHRKPCKMPKIRRYYIQAETIEWDYAPTGMDNFMGMELPAIHHKKPNQIGTKYLKAKYVEYTDETFTTKKHQPADMGILGPVIRGVVGEQLRILFRNKLPFPASIHPHGVLYDKASEGAGYVEKPGGPFVSPNSGDAVMPGEEFEYVFNVPERAGPLTGNPLSSIAWMYHSHAMDEPKETQAGLIGFIVITRKGKAKKNGAPKDVDREFFVMPKIFDEQTSGFLEQNILKYLNDTGKLTDAQFQSFKNGAIRASNQKDSINGYIFINNPGIRMCEGERVRWYAGTIGAFDLHPVHWHGIVGSEDGVRRVDTVFVAPGIARVLDTEADNPGSWLFHCHIDGHMMDGMVDIFHIDKCKKKSRE